jgi:hypothetical protein
MSDSHTHFDSRDHLRLFLALAGMALALRLLPLLRHGAAWSILDDSNEYLALVQGMGSGCGFARMVDGSCKSPELLRLPGYPLFVEMMPSLRAVVGAQALLGAATCLMVGLFTCSRWGPAAGVVAQILLALDIPSIVASSTIMSDSLFEAMLASAILLQLIAIADRWRGKAVLLALIAASILAFAVSLRGVAIVLPLLAGVPFMLIPRLALKQRLGLFVIATAIPATVMLGWTIRNYSRTGRWTFTTEGAYNLYYYNSAGVLWYQHGGSLTQIQNRLARAIGADGPDEYVSVDQQREMYDRARAVLARHPVDTLVMSLRSVAWLAIVPDRANLNALLRTHARSSVFLIASQGTAQRIRETLHSPLLSAFVALQIPLVIAMWAGVALALVRAVVRPRREIAAILLPLGVAFLMLLTGAGPGAIARFRMPALPFLGMLSGLGWSQTFTRRPRSDDLVTVSGPSSPPAEATVA